MHTHLEQWPGSSWGFAALLKGLTSSWDSNPHVRVTSLTLYPLGHGCPNTECSRPVLDVDFKQTWMKQHASTVSKWVIESNEFLNKLVESVIHWITLRQSLNLFLNDSKKINKFVDKVWIIFWITQRKSINSFLTETKFWTYQLSQWLIESLINIATWFMSWFNVLEKKFFFFKE